MSGGRDSRIAFVGELSDEEDVFRWSGLFDVHWETLEGTGYGRGPEGVPVEEAIAWAREHAVFVNVRVDDGDPCYSAGERHLSELGGEEGDEELVWPAEGLVIRPRPDGTPLDGSVQEIGWRVQAEADDVPEPTPALLEALRAAFGSNPRLHDIELVRLGRPEGIGRYVHWLRSWGIEVSCTVRAERSLDALIEADGAVNEALAELFPEGEDQCISTSCLGPANRVNAPVR